MEKEKLNKIKEISEKARKEVERTFGNVFMAWNHGKNKDKN